MSVFQRIAARLIAISERRSPDFQIGGAANPYINRWWLLPRNPFLNIYLHQILRSDDDRALHDHPWINCSIILRGDYLEWLPGDSCAFRGAGDIIFRRASATHRLELLASWESRYNTEKHCWSLFITGPRIRAWGFHCPQGFVPWQDFTAPGAKGEIGKGCSE